MVIGNLILVERLPTRPQWRARCGCGRETTVIPSAQVKRNLAADRGCGRSTMCVVCCQEFTLSFPSHRSLTRRGVLAHLERKDALEREHETAAAIVAELLPVLRQKNKKWASILAAWFGLEDRQEKTLGELAVTYGLSKQRIQQIVQRGLVILRERFQENGPADLL